MHFMNLLSTLTGRIKNLRNPISPNNKTAKRDSITPLFSSTSVQNCYITYFRNISFFLIILISSCSPDNSKSKLLSSPEIDADKAFDLLEKGAAIKPRHSGSPGAAETVKFITENIRESGVSYSLDKWSENTPAGIIEFCNIIADIPGKSDKYILVGCHYDGKKLASVPDFEGANDGASGVGVLLAMIHAVKSYPTPSPYSLKFVFFDGEECIINYSENDGLYGSRHYADILKKNGSIKQCIAVVILDMIGDKNLNITLPSGTDKKLGALMIRIAKKQNTEKYFSWYESDIIDDHSPFQKQDIPVIDIIDFHFGGPANRYWHTSADTVDKTSEKSLKITGNATLQLLWNIKHK